MPTAATTRTLRPASVTRPPATKIVSPPLQLRLSPSCMECVASARVHSTDTRTASRSTLGKRTPSARPLQVMPGIHIQWASRTGGFRKPLWKLGACAAPAAATIMRRSG
eukprot:8473256-Pyramimonas_sp.AAC.1